MQFSDQEPATKGDVRALRIELKTEIRDALTDFSRTIMAEMRELLRPIQISVARHEGDIADIRADLKAVRADMVTRDEFNSRMDGFAGLLLDSRQRWSVHADTLKRHEERLDKLEGKPS